MTTLPDWLGIVDSYDKATEWPNDDEGQRMCISTTGKLLYIMSKPEAYQWVRVRSYREGVEAALAELERNDIHVPSCLREMLAPPKPPIGIGEQVEYRSPFLPIPTQWLPSVVVKVKDGTMWIATSTECYAGISITSVDDEGKTWRRKS